EDVIADRRPLLDDEHGRGLDRVAAVALGGLVVGAHPVHQVQRGGQRGGSGAHEEDGGLHALALHRRPDDPPASCGGARADGPALGSTEPRARRPRTPGGSRKWVGRGAPLPAQPGYDARVRSVETGLVDIAREFLLAHQQLRELFERHRRGVLRWEEVQRLVGDTESSVLFRLKERCHALFRAREPGSESALPAASARVALFDLAVGSLFQERIKLRERFYQPGVYAPKVEALRSQAEPGAEGLFEEFARILAASRERVAEALAESEALLEQTRRQFRVLLAAHRGNGLVMRYLLENASLAEEVL